MDVLNIVYVVKKHHTVHPYSTLW